MRRFVIVLCATVAVGVATIGEKAEASVSLSGALVGLDSNTVKDDGVGGYAYAIDRTVANTFHFPADSPVTITGAVDVRGLVSGSYLQIGLVDKEQADLSLDKYGWGGYMFNNSALATFYAGTSNYARLADNNDLYSDPLSNASGQIAGVFDFTLDILSDGTMGLTLHGTGSDVSTTYTYGHRNWWDGWSGWSGGELANGAYLIAQLWIDTGDKTHPVFASYDIAVAGVPEPATMVVWTLLGAGSWLGMRVWRRGCPAGRQPWLPENRQAIHDIVARGVQR